jgi:hypothetical protein
MTIELALEWARAGCRVLPVNGTNKRPLVTAWQEVCTTDETTIRAWWARYPSARVGIATGEPGYDVLDFDVAQGKPGLDQLEKLIDLGLLQPGAFWVAATPSGGRHLWFRGTTQRNKQNDKSVPGVDFRGVGGMVLVPGNPGYRWVSGRSTLPDDLKAVEWDSVVRALVEPLPAPEPSRVLASAEPARLEQPRPVVQSLGKLTAPIQFVNDPGQESPLDWYCNNNDLNDLLRRDGWTWMYEHGGRQYWCRPGKETRDGASANVMINPNDGRQTLMNFSTSVDLPTDRGLSAAQYYAYREHGGDVRQAAREIRRTMMPRPQGTNQTAVGGIAAPAVSSGPSVGPPSAELVPAGADTPEHISRFWEARPELREVWWQAQVSDTSPWAILGTILACVAGRIGPHVRIPPKGGVGQAASLNLLVAISGDSGEGKGVSGQVARGFMGAPYPPWRKPGTGQGIAAIYTEQTKEGPVQSNDTAILNVTEITQLGAHMEQRGATITSTLLEVYMGEELGEHYANKELRRPVREGAYRLALVAGVQPDNAGIIFDHASSGLPQRFVWLPAYWRDAVLPEGLLEPPAPGGVLRKWHGWSQVHPGTLDETLQVADDWTPSTGLAAPEKGKKKAEPEALPAPSKDELLVTYAPGLARLIQADQRRRRNEVKRRKDAGEDSADPDSHILLTKIKIAALLAAWLDGTIHITEEIWGYAGVVIWISNATRIEAHNRILKKAASKNAARAHATVAQKEIVDEAADRKHTEVYVKALERLQHITGRIGDWAGVRRIKQGMDSREKKRMSDAGVEMADVLNDLVIAGKLESRETDKSGNITTEWRAK